MQPKYGLFSFHFITSEVFVSFSFYVQTAWKLNLKYYSAHSRWIALESAAKVP